MTWHLYVAAVVFLSLPTLLLLVWPALKLFDLKGLWRVLWLAFWPVMLAAWLADVIVARTWWVLLFGWPKCNEVTISHTLERLIGEHEHKSWALAASIAQELDRISPGHIKILRR
ncbi:hypothetical protein AEP_00511 [Curvibacter sp. AEP1-3]|uniref:hypothetical protein n=1 Tax=Curvibacter sp. AEP1-3 TaxID=1844971 RepID=UPI000B3C4FB1|nr:hypothetical protein [Curvibacter sp. AEP1-3]ARV17471.1 hypothetical protein AEP_00511 [Curvibacter sp. AEP1-3]